MALGNLGLIALLVVAVLSGLAYLTKVKVPSELIGIAWFILAVLILIGR